VKLIPFSGQYLRLSEPLPFGVRDDAGRLLLAAGRLIESDEMLAEFRAQALFSDEAESAEWNRRLAAAMDQMLRQGASLKAVSEARPEAATREAKPAKALTLTEMWQELVVHLDQALRDVRPDGDWLQRVRGVHTRARMLAQKRLDASLYHLVYAAAHSVEKYSCHHALLSMLMSEQAASMLGWPEPWTDSLGRAALTMNVAMVKLQDQLAVTQHSPTTDMRAEINAHATTGARLLASAGLQDELACAVVALHHDNSQEDVPLAELPPERQLARLLRRVDIFGAKISRRASRAPMSPVQAAREACLGQAGVPDEIGGALLKAVGLYPPGSFVELVCGEVGIVVARGRRANLPYVASLVSAAGNVLGEPALRDTIEARYHVKSAVPPNQVKVRPPHERLLAMR
jgi:HD-GYP domain-containing protein (c-di-GMP phosphodiesterase class II)